MALVVADRVKETTTTTGTGTITLAGAATGFRSFSVVGNGNTTYYTIAGQTGGEWEVGIGTYTSSGTTLSRDTVLASSNSGSLVVFSAGTKDVFVTYPAGYSVATQFANTFTANQVISDNSANAALRITQTGAGNALLVEDSANPDSTPFIVTTDGQVVSGSTSTYTISGTTSKRIQSISTGGDAGFSSSYWAATASGTTQQMMKSRGATVGDYTVVQNGDTIGTLMWGGADGTAFIQAASIIGVVDGTPGTNDMPGRLVFSTTADGASSPTERMRIDNAGQVGIGGTPVAGRTFTVAKNTTGGVNGIGVAITATTLSDVTTASYGTFTALATQATAFTLGSMYHYAATQGTIGAGSTVTNQYGFSAGSSLTGATNNYGFFSNIASGTGRWNFYAAGTADNYFAGNLGLGTSTPSYKLDAQGSGSIYVRARSTDTTGSTIGYLGAEHASGSTIQIRAGVGYTYLVSTGASDPLLFGTAGAEQMRLTSTGLGIGTSSPTQKLEVAGTVYSTTGGFKFPDGTTQTSAGASTGKAIAFSMILGG